MAYTTTINCAFQPNWNWKSPKRNRKYMKMED